MMESFQNNQALPWEFRDPENAQPSGDVLEIESMSVAGQKVDRYPAVVHRRKTEGLTENGRRY